MANPDETKGRVKQAAGDLTDNDRLKNEGKTDEAAGSIKDKVSGAVDAVKDKLNKKEQVYQIHPNRDFQLEGLM